MAEFPKGDVFFPDKLDLEPKVRSHSLSVAIARYLAGTCNQCMGSGKVCTGFRENHEAMIEPCWRCRELREALGE